jgi:hypothetical protein
MNNLKQLIQELQMINFWSRIFRWNSIKQLLLKAASDIESADITLQQSKENKELAERAMNQFKVKSDAAEARVTDLQFDKQQQTLELQTLRDKLTSLEANIAALNKNEQFRRTEHQESMNTLKELKDRTDAERAEMKQSAHQLEIDRLNRLKATWTLHQEDTKNKIRLLSQRHTIDYVDKVPFKGEPDNTLMICGEYVIFDAKSPAGDDLKNFPTYLKKEAENALKYAEKENVRTDIFFVVPSNTLEVLSHTYFTFPKHRVFVIASEGLEPVLISLKKIEAYEFAEQLSPEDRQNICSVIGRMLHHTKRRIQVDQYFDKEALALAGDCKNLLPAEIVDEVERIERALYLNPPQERAGKEINMNTLIKENKQIEKGIQETGLIDGAGSTADVI